MVCKATSSTKAGKAGFSISSTLMAMGLTGLILASATVAYVLSMRSFASFQNSIALDQQNRQAADRIAAELRHADEILAHSGGSLTFRVGVRSITFQHDPGQETLVRRENGQSRTLLRDCLSVSYRFFAQPLTNSPYGVVPTTTFPKARAVQVSWRCRRPIRGSSATVADHRTPRVVLRSSSL